MEKTDSKTENQLNHNINRLKKKNNMIVSIDSEKVLDTNTHSWKKMQDLRNRGNPTPHFKEYLQITHNFILLLDASHWVYIAHTRGKYHMRSGYWEAGAILGVAYSTIVSMIWKILYFPIKYLEVIYAYN